MKYLKHSLKLTILIVKDSILVILANKRVKKHKYYLMHTSIKYLEISK